ncbi:hypothetical protein JAAARDRAFT_176751 [Jaapia argillacea MUCL 33604]|uniref:Phytochrome n=1 Tax=Jaapia argillacea MUCL 33604 TaxID=933084 RepID=A0A067Q7W5_9AGAM|nr:hypothetical protein JAAARDRAFT_176751 [Jaapia argillacea MUCL 33604]
MRSRPVSRIGSSGARSVVERSVSPLRNPMDRIEGEIHPAVCPSNGPNAPNSTSSCVGNQCQLEGPPRFKYKHDEDPNGHFTVVGREGKLLRCEDEPICSPGAVQGYGVLVVVEEDDETGRLVVRQVSENSTQILGLTPKYLFSLNCFTETLSKRQVDNLWNNIQYLNESDPGDTEQDEAPHIFSLSGLGQPGSADGKEGRRPWACWCAAHRPPAKSTSSSPHRNLIILEFELERDTINPLYPPPDMSPPDPPNGSKMPVSSAEPVATSGPGTPSSPILPQSPEGVGSAGVEHSPDRVLHSTTNRAKPLLALERLRRMSRAVSAASSKSATDNGTQPAPGHRPRGTGSVGMMDVFAVMGQINEQLAAAPNLEAFLQIVVGVMKDLTQYHRVLVYQFDDEWNGQAVSELVDWNQSHDLYKGLWFPGSDIPVQARDLYCINRVRLLYDRAHKTARMVVKSKEDLEPPLDMTHCYLRAMSPIHTQYLESMGVRASMSISIMASGVLWGLVACHAYGDHGMRVSFPVRQMLKLLSQSISRNIDRLSYAERLNVRQLTNPTGLSDQHPSGYIVSNAEDLLGLFDADFGMLVIGDGAKILGPNQYGQEILIMAEYLRLKKFPTMQVSSLVTQDYPDLHLTMGLEVISGLLYVPLSSEGKEFIAFLRKGEPREVHWAGKPPEHLSKEGELLAPRESFSSWSEIITGKCRPWTGEQLETAGVLALVYGKFIEVWRQKENSLQTNKLTELLLSNAGHEVRTPLNHIINYLEMALNGPLDLETRDNLLQSRNASKSLLFTINDLLDLARLESGNETCFSEAFNLPSAIEDAVQLYRDEAARRGLTFHLDIDLTPREVRVIGDAKKIKTVVANLAANALKFTSEGSIFVKCSPFAEPDGLRDGSEIVIEIIVADTGCGMGSLKLEGIFREFERVETAAPGSNEEGLGLGLAVVARIVEQLGGQLRVESQEGEGSQFSFLVPFSLRHRSASQSSRSSFSSSRSPPILSRVNSSSSRVGRRVGSVMSNRLSNGIPPTPNGCVSVHPSVQSGVASPLGVTPPPPKLSIGPTTDALGAKLTGPELMIERNLNGSKPPDSLGISKTEAMTKRRFLVVDDDDINRIILAKRLTLDGHDVVPSRNGQECLDTIQIDEQFDCILMDLQMPIVNGWQATKRVREWEKASEAGKHLPIFAVSASLYEARRQEIMDAGFNGWILKPVDFKRLRLVIKGLTDPVQRSSDTYRPGYRWESGGWLL